ncbi:hypothetical protein D910_04483 [Dendroctonus ponderosae]|uniref:Patronin n=1 Tax=Dendroctonus ponderosae TaxID=77166 RepID=U4U1Y4_DENPD|nr:hypothetical protein D910_04483 [Dendroctonus ponderosae]
MLRDSKNQEHLKPQIAGALANAEIYCRALANIYSDPNYHNLNHWAILQTLARKNAFAPEAPDGSQLTETTLIQTNPLRMSAHMAVVESIMLLYAREVITNDRVAAAVQRFSHQRVSPPRDPSSHEQGALLWIQHACDALKERIEQEAGSGALVENGGSGDRLKPPDIPASREVKDLCDGVGIAALVSYYCPDELYWTEIRISSVPSVQDSVHNLRLVRDFCQRSLPASIFHLQPEDITYLRDSMKLNLIVFLADLFNVMEIHPVSCVRDKFSAEGFPVRNAHGVVHKRNLLQPVVAPIPDLRSGLDESTAATAFQVARTPSHQPLKKSNSLQQSQQTLASEYSEDSLRRGSDESFVVHKGRNIPTLRSVQTEDPLIPARLKVSKEKQNNDSKADETGEVAAGKPSNWQESKKSTFAGRRSRRNSTTDDSQLTIENFGGSQDNLNFIGRNPDKEMTVHVGRKISAPSFPVAIENAPVRSTLQDARGSFQLGYDNGCEEKQDDGSEKSRLKRQMSSDDITLKKFQERGLIKDLVDGDVGNRMSFADLGKQKPSDNKGIHLVYMNDREEHPVKPAVNRLGSTNGNSENRTSFATLPNQTTWQQQVSSVQSLQAQRDGSNSSETSGTSNLMASQISDIRLKLEEKRRHIESEKRRLEMAMNTQRQKVGKAAFLQAVSKGRGNLLKTAAVEAAESPKDSAAAEQGPKEKSPSPSPASVPTPKPQRPFTLQEITDDASTVEKRWLDESAPFVETRRTPDLENMDLEQYQQSLAHMNTSLTDIQSDIQRLAAQQNQMHTQQQQKLIADQQRQILQLQQQQQEYQTMQRQQSQPSPQAQYYQPQKYQPSFPSPLQSSTSAPHIPQSLYSHPSVMEQPQFFLHDNPPPAAVTPQRRTWGQPMNQPLQVITDSYMPQQPELRTWGKQPEASPGGFVLHHATDRFSDRPERFQESPLRHNESRYQNGDPDRALNHSNSFTLSQRHHQQSHFGTSHSTPSASPQHRSSVHRQISQLLDDAAAAKRQTSPVSLQALDAGGSLRDRERKISVTHAAVVAPPVDDMEPQNISFIGNNEDVALSQSLSKLNITSGSRTYRIPSPTRALISRGSPFQASPSPPTVDPLPVQISSLDTDPTAEKGFYISFDDEQPKRPKPALRSKRNSPKKERSYVETSDEAHDRREAQTRLDKKRQLERELEEERLKKEETEYRMQQQRDRIRAQREATQERQKVNAASALVIGEQNDADPVITPRMGKNATYLRSNCLKDLADERERKKERIMMLSLQRRQQQEEARARKEAESQRRKEIEKEKEEEKARRKEEQVARRAAILEQYKLKKAIEEAEREGKTLDRQDLMSLKPAPKLRSKGPARPRPKTIHIDSGSVQLAEGMSSRGRKGSTSNLDPSPAQVRGRSKISTYQNFKGRKSSSLMNLYGSSTDQESMAYRFGDTDSGLGRATPPRRAPSPGMGLRHLPSPSGPGSLPGFMSKGRRVFDDGSSDISSTPSSMMDYTGSSRKNTESIDEGPKDTQSERNAYQGQDYSENFPTLSDGSNVAVPDGGNDGSHKKYTLSKVPVRLIASHLEPTFALHLKTPDELFQSGVRHTGKSPNKISLQLLKAHQTPHLFFLFNGQINGCANAQEQHIPAQEHCESLGPRLYKQPATKSNRSIMLNAVEYCVFPGVVNREAKKRVLEEVNRSESKHFLILFRDAGCQFRALYSYCPDTELVTKLYGTGPKQVNDKMFDKFFKYNSGGKCFSQIHTKHLTVTIDAFTIHNSLWQGKKVNLPNKKDMALVV